MGGDLAGGDAAAVAAAGAGAAAAVAVAAGALGGAARAATGAWPARMSIFTAHAGCMWPIFTVVVPTGSGNCSLGLSTMCTCSVSLCTVTTPLAMASLHMGTTPAGVAPFTTTALLAVDSPITEPSAIGDKDLAWPPGGKAANDPLWQGQQP